MGQVDKVTVITVVYNDVKNIRKTIMSCLDQDYPDVEYIIIDGGSTDGTKEIINEYKGSLDYFCSEKDNGIYDALNKGILKAHGEWIIVLNSGDTFVSSNVLSSIFDNMNYDNTDVIYGDSIEQGDEAEIYVESADDISLMEYRPIYRHGASLVRRDVQKKYMYDISREDKYGFALDWDVIYRMYKDGVRFKRVNCAIERYEKDGVSNNQLKSLLYNYRISSCGKHNMSKMYYFVKSYFRYKVKNTQIQRWYRGFKHEFMLNQIIPSVPFWALRMKYMRRMRMRIGIGSFIMRSVYIIAPNKITIGNHSHINRGVILDGRGGLSIGNDVSISFGANIITGSHYVNSSTFKGKYLPIVIEDKVWIGANATILQNVVVGEGSVVCAGAVVTSDVKPYTIVGGVPARELAERNRELEYHCVGYSPFA